jgi:hypothetical protein
VENVVIFYDHLEYFAAIWQHVWPFGIVCGQLVYFSRFGMFGPRKIWQPWSRGPLCLLASIENKAESSVGCRTLKGPFFAEAVFF